MVVVIIEHMFDHRDIDIGLFPGESDQALYQLTLAELEQGADHGGQPQVVPDELEEMAPDIYLAAVLSALDRDRLTGYDLVRVAQARKRLVSSLEAAFYADIGEVAHSCDPDSVVRKETVVEFASEELQPALCWTRRRADVELGFALDLRHRLAPVAESLRSGAIDTQRARVISQETVGLDPAPRATVVDRALEIAPGLTTGQLRARIKKMCIAIDPGSMEMNFEAGIEERRLVVSANPDLTAGIAIQQVDPGDAIDAEKYVHGIAMGLKRAGGEGRSLDQLRADVAIDLLRGRTPDSVPAPEKHVVVHVRAGSENPQPALEGDWEIPGFGPILDKVAQRMIDDADVVSRRLRRQTMTVRGTPMNQSRGAPSQVKPGTCAPTTQSACFRAAACPRRDATSTIGTATRVEGGHPVPTLRHCAGGITDARTRGAGDWSAPLMAITVGPAAWVTPTGSIDLLEQPGESSPSLAGRVFPSPMLPARELSSFNLGLCRGCPQWRDRPLGGPDGPAIRGSRPLLLGSGDRGDRPARPGALGGVPAVTGQRAR